MGSTLTGMTWDHPRGYDGLAAASAEYEERTGVRVAWERRSLQAFADVPIARLADTYDLIVLDHPHVGQIAESGCLRPLPPLPPSASLGGSVESYVWQGRTWAWPVDAACQMAVARPDAVPSFPRTWEDILADGAERYRLLTPLKPVDAFDAWLTLVASLGEEHLPASPTAFASRAVGARALQVLHRLFALGPSEALDWNPIRVLEILATTDDFAGSPCLFGYINYARPGFRSHALRYVDLPVFAGCGRRRAILGGAGIGVSALRGQGDVAQDFAAWVTSEPVQSGVYLYNEGQPAHAETWRRMRDDPAHSGFLAGGHETIRTAWTRPRAEWFLNFVDEVCAVLPAWFKVGRGEDAVLDEVDALYRRCLSGGGR